ncbi:MAG: hypothetical protein A3D31_03905 [Candidatus Fluviicola riflensis]|nr:MAG: hypothetical protein A3D31_03905 [Candidatus Fluviicola riflensis]OGS86555.1 MAG: hypothetical protein A2724_03365 [Fluviicola sp. RIFCSPHIGHO2_01_FULL_43_53]OGS88971.1 MAG: hypothetical protein A3E30_01295 [Fluviicola sp. RIFCSPHIGHO2_12_FULL_43_24]
MSSAALYGQNGLLKTIGGAAKSKVEQQDFNSTRTNKEKLDDNDRPRSAPAPSPASEAAQPEVDSTQAPMTSSGTPAAGYDQSYTFSQKITYEMQDLSKPKTEKLNMTHFYSDNAIMSVTGTEMNIIFDFTHESMIMLNEKEMTAMVMSSSMAVGMANKQAEESGTATMVKTGKTKKILGYNCDEYLITDEKHTSNCWVTSEIGIDGTKAAKAMGVPQTAGENGKGIMMEFTSFDKKGVAETYMIMTEYKEESTTKSLSSYKITSM